MGLKPDNEESESAKSGEEGTDGGEICRCGVSLKDRKRRVD